MRLKNKKNDPEYGGNASEDVINGVCKSDMEKDFITWTEESKKIKNDDIKIIFNDDTEEIVNE